MKMTQHERDLCQRFGVDPVKYAAHPLVQARAPTVPTIAHTAPATTADGPLTLTAAEQAVCEAFDIDPRRALSALRLHLLRGGDRREFFGL